MIGFKALAIGVAIAAAAVAATDEARAQGAQPTAGWTAGQVTVPSPRPRDPQRIWTDEAGRTLYTFDKDSWGVSNCTGPCAINWEPLWAGFNSTGGGDWTVVTRSDLRLQWAYKGYPVYRWWYDRQPGQMSGQGYANDWYDVPVGAAVHRDDTPPPAPAPVRRARRPAAAPATPAAPAAQPRRS
jgi:predicted lipoprotein with Yx(FWY)xxD motif